MLSRSIHYCCLHLQGVCSTPRHTVWWALCYPEAACGLVFHGHRSFSVPYGALLPHTIPHISHYPAPVEPPWSPLRWHIKATLLSQQPETPLIHQAPWLSSLPSLYNFSNSRDTKFTMMFFFSFLFIYLFFLKTVYNKSWEAAVWEYMSGREGSVFFKMSERNGIKEERWSERGFTGYGNCFFQVVSISIW